MPHDSQENGLTKFPRPQAFRAEAEQQGKLLCARPEEREAMAFIEAAFSWPEP